MLQVRWTIEGACLRYSRRGVRVINEGIIYRIQARNEPGTLLKLIPSATCNISTSRDEDIEINFNRDVQHFYMREVSIHFIFPCPETRLLINPECDVQHFYINLGIKEREIQYLILINKMRISKLISFATCNNTPSRS